MPTGSRIIERRAFAKAPARAAGVQASAMHVVAELRNVTRCDAGSAWGAQAKRAAELSSDLS
jgi:hypothetical protein